MERSVKTTGGRLAYNKMEESLKPCFLVRLFVYLLSYLEVSRSLSHFGSAEAFVYKDRSSEKSASMLIFGSAVPYPARVSHTC